MGKLSFVIVSNRLPVSVSKVDGILTYTPSNGGLATAMSSINFEGDQLWIGWPGIASDDLTPAERAAITRKLRKFGCYPVFLTREQIRLFYEGYSNDTLWPLFHYFQSLAVHDNRYWTAYCEVNRLYSQAIVRHADPHAAIWVHDYQLMLVPALLRKQLPASSIGFFLHIPFPSFEIFRLLPERREILEGLLGADLVGFHIYDYARHFMSSVLRALGHEHRHGMITVGERVVSVDAFPIGIDYKRWTAALGEPAVIDEMKILETSYAHKKIIVSVDRLDYSKGIMNRLEAFEQFLRRYPSYHKKVSLVVVAVPSRIEVEAYKDLRDTVEQTVSRINGMYGEVDWTPISYQFKNLPFAQIVALYAKADVALVTPLRDGMNLVAKEFVAAKQHSPGVLILSEMAGAVDELPEALRINPNDTKSIVQSIRSALRMPKSEQKKRLQSMQRRISRYHVGRWAKDFMEQLNYAKGAKDRLNSPMTTQEQLDMQTAFTNAHRRLLFFDYDGVLKGFVASPDPAKAAPDRHTLQTIEKLARLPDTEVCIVSGRTREALEAWFGHLPVSLAAEHGSWVRQGGEWFQQDVSMAEFKQTLLPMLERYAERTPGAEVEEKNFALVWHYRNVQPELAYARNASLRHDLSAVLANSDIGVYGGKKIIEIKPRAISKGVVVDEMLANTDADFVAAIGDDYTDEDMFRSLPETAYTIKVGSGDTHARFRLEDVSSVHGLLQYLLKAQTHR